MNKEAQMLQYVKEYVEELYAKAVKSDEPAAQEPLVKILYLMETEDERENAEPGKWEEYVNRRLGIAKAMLAEKCPGHKSTAGETVYCDSRCS